MIIDTPYWVCHGHEFGISSIDVHPSGRRLVTCSTDPQIKIWNLLPILDPAAEADPAVPKLLATLSEHQGAVSVARFNHAGGLLASGGNDNAVLLYRLHPGPATAKLGSGTRAANLENWKTVGALRGHSLDVTGLSWAPDDSLLASCGMEGAVLLWRVGPEGSGQLVHSIRAAHNGWVKGLEFDPLGRFLASQGRNGVKIWDVASWEEVAHSCDMFQGTPETGFTYRISWSPDGLQLLAANAMSGGRPTICLLARHSWTPTHMVGHKSSVVAAAANPKLFHVPKALLAARAAAGGTGTESAGDGEGEAADEKQQQQQQQGEKAQVAAKRRASLSDTDFEQGAAVVLAAGSNDRSMSVWCSELALPLTHCSQVHSGAVADLAWTPDGYTLISTSNDDSITVLRFAECELGRCLTDEEFAGVLREEYGDYAAAAAGPAAAGGAAAAAAGTRAAAGGAADRELLLEDAELAALAAESAAVPLPALPAPPAAAAPAPAAVAAAAASAAAAAGGLLERRLMPTGAGITTGTLPKQQQQQQQLASRKRPHPAAAGAAAAGAAAGPAGKRLGPPAAAVQRAGGSLQQQQQQQQQLGRPVNRAAAAAAAAGEPWVLGAPLLQANLEVQLSVLPVLPGQPQGQAGLPVRMTALNGSSSSSSRGPGAAVAELAVHVGQEVLWRDRVEGQVVALAGGAFWSAAATASGLLHTWRTGGNMLLPPLALGPPPVKLEAAGPWQLLLVAADGELGVLDLERFSRVLGPPPPVSLAPVIAVSPSGTTFRDAWLAAAAPAAAAAADGSIPTATLSDGSGWMFHRGLGLWMAVQAGVGSLVAAASSRSSLLQLEGDAGRLRQAAAEAAAAAGTGGHALALAPDDAAALAVWQRKEAELQLFRALQLRDGDGYRHWLGLLVSHLAMHRENGRLKELAQDLLGPERWLPHMAGSHPWQPAVLGHDRRALLRQLLVPAAARAGLPIATAILKALNAAELHVRSHGQEQAQQQQQQQQQQYLSPGLLPFARPAGAAGAGGPGGGLANGVGSATLPAAADGEGGGLQWAAAAAAGPLGDAGSGRGACLTPRHQQQQQQQQGGAAPAVTRIQATRVDGDSGAAASAGAGAAAVVGGGREPLVSLQPGQTLLPQRQQQQAGEADKASSRTPSADNVAAVS